jgi:predicted restriction endonuclease
MREELALKSGKEWMGEVLWWFPERRAEGNSEIREFLRRVNALIAGHVNYRAAVEPALALTVTEKDAVLKARICQGRFRQELLDQWRGCSVTGCTVPQFLRASHIKPWAVANSRERQDRNNGLLLLANLDAAFECGLISFSNSGRILISRSLAPDDRQLLGIAATMRLRRAPSPPQQAYLAYHRDQKFLE